MIACVNTEYLCIGIVGDGVCPAYRQHRVQWTEFAAQALGRQV